MKSSRLASLTPVGIGFLLVLPSIVWIALDESVWPWDQSWYGEVSFDLWAMLQNAPRRWPDAMLTAFGSKAPGVAWIGQFFLPLGRVVGDQRALLASVVVCQIASLTLVFAACRRLGPGALAAFAGTLVVGASPLFVWTTHEYLTEPLQTLTVAWSLLLLALAGSAANPVAIAAQLPGVVGVAFLAKLSSPLYIALPVAATVVLLVPRMVDGSPGRRACLRDPRAIGGAAGSALVLLGTGLWYGVNLDAALAHARVAQDDTGLYGTDRGMGAELAEWTGRLSDATFLPATGVAMLVVMLAGLGWRLVRRPTLRPSRPVLVATICLAELGLVLFAFASQPNEEARFLVPAIPFVGVAVAVVLSNAPRSLVACGLLVLSIELLFVTLQEFGTAPVRRLTYYRLDEPARDAALRHELERLVDTTCTERTNRRITVVGADHPWFNGNTLTMIAAGRNSVPQRKCYYTALGYAESDPDQAWKRIVALDPPFYVAIDYGAARNLLPPSFRSEAARADPFNRVNRTVMRRVRASTAFAVVAGSRRYGFVIFERVGPLR